MGLAEILVLAGATAGGFVSGLTGFGSGLSVLPLWLRVLPPVRAAPLVMARLVLKPFLCRDTTAATVATA